MNIYVLSIYFFVQLIQYTLSYSILPLNINGKTIYQIEIKKGINSRRAKRFYPNLCISIYSSNLCYDIYQK